MATPLTDSINALTQYANEVTGKSDTNLSDAVYTLAHGYGSGSSLSVDVEEITIPSDMIGTFTSVMSTFEETFPQWDGSKYCLVLADAIATGGTNQYKLIYMYGNLTSSNMYKGGAIRNDSGSSINLSSTGASSAYIKLLKNDKYLIIG